MKKDERIYVAGHSGLIGSAITRHLKRDGYLNIITRSHAELDLTDQNRVKVFFERERPDYVFFAAAKVGGVYANSTYRAEYIYENIMMQNNIIHHAFLNEVKKMIFFASADIYPRDCPQPAKEDYLLTGRLEPTCEPFAIAKLSGVKMCESYNTQYGTDFIVVIPPNAYGPKQHYDVMNAQVLPSLMKRFHEAKRNGSGQVVIWGTGSPIRDFLYVDDIADASLFLMNSDTTEYLFNVGTGKGTTIGELADIIRNEVGYQGEIVFDRSKPEGVPMKLLDASRVGGLGWHHRTEMADGVRMTYESFFKEVEERRIRTTQIFEIHPSRKDVNTLKEARKRRLLSLNDQPDTYNNHVVIKPWGHEYQIYSDENIAVWLLYIRMGYSTSMHCHPLKKTSIVLLSGSAMSNTFQHRRYLYTGDALNIEKGVFHSTKALSNDGIYLLEIETPPKKTDLVRLRDNYGREESGYEGMLEMETHDLKEYDYFHFEDTEHYERYIHANDRYAVVFEVFPGNQELHRYLKIEEGKLYILCRGKLLDGAGHVVLDVGSVEKADHLSTYEELNTPGKAALLQIETKP